MFAKVFGQIFDSSIAEDYNCRRMFMDMLVLADSDGVVDMTHEAISRRTNVPVEEVRKYIGELQQPDRASRSKMEEGRRLIPVDSERDWGWQIVNYRHYRQIRDEEARRTYFREQKRKQRNKNKIQSVQDNQVDKGGHCQTIASASSSDLVREFARGEGIPDSDADWFFWKCEGNGWTNGGKPIRNWKATLRSWKQAKYLPSQKPGVGIKSGVQAEKESRLEKEMKEAKERYEQRRKSRSDNRDVQQGEL